MKLEDTKLPDHEAVRTAFKKAQFQVAVENMGKAEPQKDTGIGAASLTLFVRAGEVLHETIPTAVPEQVAATVLFLNYGFQEPSLMKIAHGKDLPLVCNWAQEWREINRGTARLEEASLELRQIITAVNIALIEGFIKNLPSLNADNLRKDMEEKDLITKQIGDIKAPALEQKLKQVRSEIEQELKEQRRVFKFLRRSRI